MGLAARFGLEGDFANFLGVALWSVLVLLLLVFVRPQAPALALGGGALALSYGVEAFQLTGIPLRLNDISGLFRLVLGTHFAWDDFPAYTAGCAFATAVLWLVRDRSRSPTE